MKAGNEKEVKEKYELLKIKYKVRLSNICHPLLVFILGTRNFLGLQYTAKLI